MREKWVCKKCKREYDPVEEYIDFPELLRALTFWVSTDDYCPACINTLRIQITKIVCSFVNG